MRNGLGACALPHRRSSDLSNQLRDVFVALGHQLLAANFGADSILQELGCSQPSSLDELVEFVRKVDLHPWHTPNYTHTASSGKTANAVAESWGVEEFGVSEFGAEHQK